MSSNLNKKEIKGLNSKDSSELSSYSETNESIDNLKAYQIEENEINLTDDFNSIKKVIIKKRPRFFSENKKIEFIKVLCPPRIKKIKNNLRKITENEMVDLNKRKFSFI